MPDSSVLINDRYRVMSVLGKGGMGIAYRAWDSVTQVPVVIKMPLAPEDTRADAYERFRREAREMASLAHPHIVPVLDQGTDSAGAPYIVIRFLPGGALADRLRRNGRGETRPNAPATLHTWLPQIAAALDFMHSRGVVHRDVKPANIFFDARSNAFLGDFGIAKVFSASNEAEKDVTLTATNVAIGTQAYMAPELFRPKPLLSGAVDQYSLAITVYEIVAGFRPFRGETAHIIVEHLSLPPKALRTLLPSLPASLSDAVVRGLAKDAEKRFGSCLEFAHAVLNAVPQQASVKGTAWVMCPSCRRILSLTNHAAGKLAKCNRCEATLRIASDLESVWLARESNQEQDKAIANAEPATGVSSKASKTLSDALLPHSLLRGIGKAVAEWRHIIAVAICASLLCAVFWSLMVPEWATSGRTHNAPHASSDSERPEQLNTASIDIVQGRGDPLTHSDSAAQHKDVGDTIAARKRETLPTTMHSSTVALMPPQMPDDAGGTKVLSVPNGVTANAGPPLSVPKALLGERLSYRCGDWCGVWTQRGATQIFDCTATHAKAGCTEKYMSVLTYDGTSVEWRISEREHSLNGRVPDSRLSGSLSPDGRTVRFKDPPNDDHVISTQGISEPDDATATRDARFAVEPIRFDFTHVSDAMRFEAAKAGINIYTERQSPPLQYYGPSTNDEKGILTLLFDFAAPVRRIQLKVSTFCVDFSGAGGGKGASAVRVSTDGKSWVTLEDDIQNERWGKSLELDSELPSSFSGTTTLWLRIELLQTSIPHDYAAAQFGRSDSTSRNAFLSVIADRESQASDVVRRNGAGSPRSAAWRLDPGTLTKYHSAVGRTMQFKVTGAIGGGSVWGGNPYTSDSSLAEAAVHAGALQPGEDGLVTVTILPGLTSYPGVSRNGVTSGQWGPWAFSYRIDNVVESQREPDNGSAGDTLVPTKGSFTNPIGAPERPQLTHDLDAASLEKLKTFVREFRQTGFDVENLLAAVAVLVDDEQLNDEARASVVDLQKLLRARDWIMKNGARSNGRVLRIASDRINIDTTKYDGWIKRSLMSESCQKVVTRIELLAQRLHSVASERLVQHRLPSMLLAGKKITAGGNITSESGRYMAVLQGDGDFVVLRQKDGAKLWSTKTAGSGAAYVMLQADGNLILEKQPGAVVWQSRSGGHPNAHLVVQDDGNLVIYEDATATRWIWSAHCVDIR